MPDSMDIFDSGVQRDTRPQPSKADNIYTPPEATMQIVPFLNRQWRLWEGCYGRGDMYNTLVEAGFSVKGGPDEDYFHHIANTDWDCLVTNPPYSNHRDFVRAAINTGKPFAFLLRLAHLGGKTAYELYSRNDIQVIIPARRIHFFTPSGKSSNMFHNVWLTRGLGLEKDLLYIPS